MKNLLKFANILKYEKMRFMEKYNQVKIQKWNLVMTGMSIMVKVPVSVGSKIPLVL
jgi:hypothetical protein